MINSVKIINTDEHHLVCFIIMSSIVSKDFRLRMHPEDDLGT